MHISKPNANFFSVFIIKNILKTINPCIVIKISRQFFALIYANFVMIYSFHNTFPYKYLLPNSVILYTSNSSKMFYCIRKQYISIV